ncbi:GNAT family N-acetyltransferase [Actinoplanes sp. NPDC024001]|uniref:GNAT family N-acetyltransferase n=1 Tax=Actinoplanes sp. NPDC024001 TaxID=3154598 RepID=UPI00340BDBE0
MTIELWSADGRLRLRPWSAGDLPAVVAAAGDPLLRRWTSLPAPDVAEAERWLGAQDHGWASGERLSFAVHDGDRLAGGVVLKNAERAEAGYWTVAAFRGRGVAPRALEAICGWARAAGRTELDLMHQVDNAASCRVAEKSGFELRRVLPAQPPFPRAGHLHTRQL